jgi:hypothetical protein
MVNAKKIAGLIAIASVIGCSTQTYWVKNGATIQDFEMDKAQCNAQALSVPNITIPMLALIQNQCLRGKGWNLQAK